MITLVLLLLAAQPAAGAAPVSPDGPSPSAAPATAKAAAKGSDRDTVVCRTSMQTGHHIVDRVCHTRYDWDRMETDGKAYADRLLRSQFSCAGFTAAPC